MATQARNKVTVNMRLSDRTRQYLALLTDKLDTNQTSVTERAIRELAEREGIRLPSANTTQEADAGE